MRTNVKEVCAKIAERLKITPIKANINLRPLSKIREILHSTTFTQNFVCIEGRPGMGKTALALDIALDTAVMTNNSVLIFSLEPLAEHTVALLIQKLSGINIRKLNGQQLSETDKNKLSAAIAFLQELDIRIDDSSKVTPDYIEKCLQNCSTPELVVIDYIQLMYENESGDPFKQDQNQIAKQLKMISQKYSVQIIALTQVERITDKNRLYYFRHMFSKNHLQQIVDIDMFIYRPEYYTPNIPDDGVQIWITQNYFEYYCKEKFYTINMRFDKKTLSFKEE